MASRTYRQASGHADLKSAGQAGQGVAIAQVGQGEQGFPAGSRRRQRDRRWVRWNRMRSARWFRLRVDSGIAAG